MDLKRLLSLCSAAVKGLTTADACWESLSHPQPRHLRFAPHTVFFIIYPYLKSSWIPKRLFPLQSDSVALSIAALDFLFCFYHHGKSNIYISSRPKICR